MPATDEDIVRDLLHRSTDHVRPAAAIATGVAARQRRQDRRRRVACLTAASAALGTAAGLIAIVPWPLVPGARRPGRDRRVAASDQADRRPARDLPPQLRRGQAAARAGPLRGDEHGGGNEVKDTSVIDSRTGNMWSYQAGTDGNPSGKAFTPRPTRRPPGSSWPCRPALPPCAPPSSPSGRRAE